MKNIIYGGNQGAHNSNKYQLEEAPNFDNDYIDMTNVNNKGNNFSTFNH